MTLVAAPSSDTLSEQARVGRRCPKQMAYGPCGGVDDGGRCEVPEVGDCVFLGAPPRPWAGPTVVAAPTTTPRVVAHLVAPSRDGEALRGAAAVLVGSVDAVLLGDGPSARVQLPPSYRARLLLDDGVPVLAGMNCRDRNRVALEGELLALAELRPCGLVGVHCVTGDHVVRGDRPDAAPVFDLDATRLVALAAALGLTVSVAAAPSAPPGPAGRAGQLAVKVAAGARFAMLDDTGPDGLELFTAALAAAQATVPLLVCVPVLTSAAAVHAYPGAHLPAEVAAEVALARDPRAAGLALAVRLAERAREVRGVAGVHLSPGVVVGREAEAMADLAEVGRRLAA